MKEKVRNFLETFTTIMTGMTAGSLWFSDNDNWKYYLPVVLCGLGLLRIFDAHLKQ